MAKKEIQENKKSKIESDSKKFKVLLVDDHPIVRQGLAQTINAQNDLIVCGEAEDAHRALEAIGSLNPDVALVDISLKGMNGLELIKNIKVHYPKFPVVVLSMHDETLYAQRVLKAGAKGFIMKHEAGDKVLLALRRALNGEIYLSEKMSSRLLHQLVDGRSEGGLSPLEQLSDRELEVFQLIGHGRGTSQIAKELHLSVKTVESYRANIKEKMKIGSAPELVQHATQWVQNAM